MMDAANVAPEEFHACLRHLEIINKITLGYRPTLAWLKKTIPSFPPARSISIYDVGSGRGDMLRRIYRWARRNNIAVDLAGIDVNPIAARAARAVTPSYYPIRYETTNIFALSPEKKADFVISSLFTHHLSDQEIIRFIGWMEAHAVKGWFINDLHRHVFPYWFIGVITGLFRANRLVRHDAPASVAKAFTAEDWKRLLKQAGVRENVSIDWRFPFRYCISRWKT